MFDGIGKSGDAESRKRDATSVGLTTLLLAGVIGFHAGVAALLFTEVLAPEPEDVELVMLVETVDDHGGDKLVAPPPPPLGGGRADAPDDVRPTASEPTPEATPAPAPAPASPAPAGPGTPDGDPDGVPGGRTGGIPGGDSNSKGTGDGGGSGPTAFHVSELRRVRAVDPIYPRSARGLGLGEVTCKVHVILEATGVPSSVEVTGCPAVFHAETKEAILRSRWAPPKADGKAVPASTVMLIHFVER